MFTVAKDEVLLQTWPTSLIYTLPTLIRRSPKKNYINFARLSLEILSLIGSNHKRKYRVSYSMDFKDIASI